MSIDPMDAEREEGIIEIEREFLRKISRRPKRAPPEAVTAARGGHRPEERSRANLKTCTNRTTPRS